MNIPILGTLLIRGIDEFLAMTFGLMVSVLLTNKATEWLGVRFLILFVPVRTIGESKMPALNARFQRAYARGVLNGNRANLVRSLIGLMPIMELGINKQINGAAEQGLLSDRDLFTLQLLADRRTAYSVSNEYGIFNTPDNFKRDVVLEMVNPYEDGYHAKLRELNNTSRFQNTVVYLPVDSRELRGLGITFRNLRLTNQLTSKAIRTALQTKDPMRLTVRVHSKNPAFLNGRRVQLLQRLERSKAFTGVEIFLFVRLEKLLMAIPVTSGDLLRMIELELKVSRLASTHA